MAVQRIPVDDTAKPVRMTPRRQAKAMEEYACSIMALAVRGRSLEVFMQDGRLSELVNGLVRIGKEVSEIGVRLLVGKEALSGEFVDVAAGRGIQPVIDAIEDKAAAKPAVDDKPAEAPKIVHPPAAETPGENGAMDDKPAGGVEVVQAAPEPEQSEGPRWAGVPVVSLTLPRAIIRKLTKGGLKTAGLIDEARDKGGAARGGLDPAEWLRAIAAVDELIAETEARDPARPESPADERDEVNDYEPSHPWYYHLGGKPLRVEEIATASLSAGSIHSSISRWPSDPGKQRARLAEVLEREKAELAARIARYTEVVDRGPDVLSGFERTRQREWENSDAGDRACSPYHSTLSLVHNHVVYSMGRVAAIEHMLAALEQAAPAVAKAPQPAPERPASTRRAPKPSAPPKAAPRADTHIATDRAPASAEPPASALAAAADAIESLRATFPETADAIGDWREIAVYDLELDGAARATADAIGCKTAGELFDWIEEHRRDGEPGKPSAFRDAVTPAIEKARQKPAAPSLRAAAEACHASHTNDGAKLDELEASGAILGPSNLWRMRIIESIGLNDAQLAVCHNLGLRNAGDLDDFLEGRDTRRPPNKLMRLGEVGASVKEWGEEYRAALRAKLDAIRPPVNSAPEWRDHDPDKNTKTQDEHGKYLKCHECRGDCSAPAPRGRGWDACHKPRIDAVAARPCAAKNWDKAPVEELGGALTAYAVKTLRDAGFFTVGDVTQAFTTHAAVDGFDDMDKEEILEAVIGFKAQAKDVPDDQVEKPSGRKPSRARA